MKSKGVPSEPEGGSSPLSRRLVIGGALAAGAGLSGVILSPDVAAATGAGEITFDPTGTSLSSTNVQDAIEELDDDLVALPELATANVNELSVSTTGGVTTLAVGSDIARDGELNTEVFNRAVGDVLLANMFGQKAVGQYYLSAYQTALGAVPTVANTVYVQPVLLWAGTIDRIGIEVKTAAAGSSVRLGIYKEIGGLPGGTDALVAEATLASAGTTGVKTQTISATIDVSGIYYLAVCAQSGAPSLFGAASTSPGVSGATYLMPIGDSPPASGTAIVTRTTSGVTGALPTNLTPTNVSARLHRVHYRYSA